MCTLWKDLTRHFLRSIQCVPDIFSNSKDDLTPVMILVMNKHFSLIKLLNSC